MKPIFAYDSYRDFLKDFYNLKKKDNPSYSYRFFSKRAGLNSENYLKLVMDGNRNMTKKTVIKFIKGLNLNEWEGLYFENLVFFNQSQDEGEKTFYLGQMDLAKAQTSRPLLSKDQYEVLSNWYPLAIKEMTLLSDFELNPRKIASRMDYKITPQQTKDAIDLLERVGLIKVDRKNAKIHVMDQSLQTPDLDTSTAIINFHKSVWDLALKSIDQVKVEERCLSSLTVAVQKKDLPEAYKKVHKFRNEMDSYFMKGKKYDSVFQLAIQLFRIDHDE